MAETRTIYVDLDDVLCHTASRLLAVIERDFGKKLLYDQLYTFDLCEACGLQPPEATEFLRIVNEPDELLLIEPIKEAVAVLEEWIGAGYEVAIVTGRPPKTYESSLEWLARHRVPYHSFIIVDKYARFTTANTIGISLSDFATQRFCWAVEDSATMAAYLADRMKVPVALLDRPWNRTADDHPLIQRHRHWHEIAQALPGNTLPKIALKKVDE